VINLKLADMATSCQCHVKFMKENVFY